jgi:SdpI/YfhL protein family
MSNEQIWYEANAYAGRLLLGMGIVCMVAAILLYLVPSLRADMVTYNVTYTGVLFIGLFVVVFFSWRYLQSL